MKRRPELSAEGWVAKKPRSAAAKWLGRGGAPAEQRFERCVVAVPPAAVWGCGTLPPLTVGAEQRAELCARAPGSSVRLPKALVDGPEANPQHAVYRALLMCPEAKPCAFSQHRCSGSTRERTTLACGPLPAPVPDSCHLTPPSEPAGGSLLPPPPPPRVGRSSSAIIAGCTFTVSHRVLTLAESEPVKRRKAFPHLGVSGMWRLQHGTSRWGRNCNNKCN